MRVEKAKILWLKGHSQLVNDKTIFMGIKIFKLYHTRLHTHKKLYIILFQWFF